MPKQISKLPEFIAPKCEQAIEILFQDEHLLVINKPSGLLSLSGKNPLNQDSVHHRIKQLLPTALLAHRLDFGTSGIMLLPLSQPVNKHICGQFSARTITKHYLARLDGTLIHKHGVIDLAIAKDCDNFPFQKICSVTGKPAQTQFEVLHIDNAQQTTLVRFTPLTGRTHQLRIHSQHLGHPILGCDLYKNEASQHKADRLMLHASDIEFIHPATQQAMVFHCPAPFSLPPNELGFIEG